MEERMFSRLGVLGLLVAIAACSNSDDRMAIDVTASVSPGANATAVPRTAVMTMDAGLVMDTAFCAGRMLLHVGGSTGPLVPGRMTWENGNRRMVFRPDSLLAPMTTYFVHVRDSMMTSDAMAGSMMSGGMTGSGGMHSMTMQPPAGGMRMGDGMGWTFTTGS
jgi:hypothetical protein